MTWPPEGGQTVAERLPRFAHGFIDFPEERVRSALDGAHRAHMETRPYLLIPFAIQITQPSTEDFQRVMDV